MAEKRSRRRVRRCEWVGDDPLMVAYHDHEWGVPVHEDRTMFEFLVLETMQAGLSWMTILRKRDAFRRAFDGFDAASVARYDEATVERLLTDPGIVRNRLKIEATVNNARRVLEIQAEFGSLWAYLWQFVGGRPIRNSLRTLADIPTRTEHSDVMSRELRRRGFKFVGSTICYAHMQATGLVNDHLVDCFRYTQI
jgi:DNA-3-methyladenine glycosylase I